MSFPRLKRRVVDMEFAAKIPRRFFHYAASPAALEPVYELKAFTPIGFRMVRRVSVVRHDREETELAPHAVAMLSTADLLGRRILDGR